MSYFDDLGFVAGDEIPHCVSVINQGWPGMCNLQFILSGRMYLGIDGGPSGVLTGPACFWHHPAHTYQYGPAEPKGHWHHLWVTFRGPRALTIMEHGFMALTPGLGMAVAQAKSFETEFRALVRLVQQEGPGSLPRATLILERLLVLLQEGQKAGDARGLHEDHIQALAAQLRDEPLQTPDLRELAKSCHLSYSHFRRLFRDYIGMAPHDYQLHCRMRWAARELQNAQRQVQEVAAAAGYDDPAQFSKLFKLKIGLSPRQFRQSLPGFGAP